MPTQQQRFQQLTDGDNFSIDGKARLPERRRRWIRLVDAPLPGAAKTTLPRYEYDMYGQPTQTVGSLASDFQYAGYYFHAPSGLNLTTFRAYNPSLGRWINRDPLDSAELLQGPNLYDYVGNDPVGKIDPLGTDGKDVAICIFNFAGCVKWCNDTGESIPAGWQRVSWVGGCIAKCAGKFPPPKSAPPQTGPKPWVGGQGPGNAFVPIPIPGTPWSWPGVPTPIGPLPIIPIWVPGTPVFI